MMTNNVPCLIFHKPNKSPNGYRDFKINKDKIMIWLNFPKTNYLFHADIHIFDAKTRLDLIYTNDDRYIHNYIC